MRPVLVIALIALFASMITAGQDDAPVFLPQRSPITPDNYDSIRLLARLDIPASLDLQEMATVAFGPNGQWLAAAGLSSKVAIWDLTSGELVRTFSDNYRVWVCLDFHPNQPVIVAGNLNGYVAFFDVETGEHLHSQRVGTSGVHSVHISSQGTHVVSVNTYAAVKVWEIQPDYSLALVSESRAHGDRVNDADFSPDGTRIVSGGADTNVRVWDVKTSQEYLVMTDARYFVEGVQYSPDGNLIAASADDHMVYVWDGATGERRGAFWGSRGPVNGVAFNSAGTLIAGFGNNQDVLIWELDKPYKAERIVAHDDYVLRGEFSPDDRLLASISRDQTVNLYGVSDDSNDEY